jgi:hypothetical protein
MSKKPVLAVVTEAADPGPQPPGPLGQPGRALWASVQKEYGVADSGGVEMLFQICSARDRLAQLADEIAADGVIVRSRAGPKPHPAIKEELGLRSFIVRALSRLGLNFEPVRASPGRPGTPIGWDGRR